MPTQITDFTSGRSELLVESSKGLKKYLVTLFLWRSDIHSNQALKVILSASLACAVHAKGLFCYVIINVSLPFSFQQILSDFGNMAVKRKIHPRVHLSLPQMGWDGIGNLQHPNYYFACFFLLLLCRLCSGLVSEIDLNSRVDFSFQTHKMTQ